MALVASLAPPPQLADLAADVLRILLRALPADARGRACCVCRRWRDVLQDAALWLELDLSPAGGVPRERRTLALLLGAAARARGGLAVLNLQGCAPELVGTALFELLAGARALRTLTFPDGSFQRAVARAAAAAPQLRLLHVDTLEVNGDGAMRVLRNEPPLAALRVRRLSLHPDRHDYDPADAYVREEPEVPLTFQALMDALGDAGAHPSLTGLDFFSLVRWDAITLARLEDVACARPLCSLSLQLDVRYVPEVARLLRSCPSLRSLCLSGYNDHSDTDVLREAHAAELAAALAAAPALTGFALCSVGLFGDTAVGAALLAGLTGHPSLRALVLDGNPLPHPQHNLRWERQAATPQARAAALAALASLLAADAPALRCVRLAFCWVDEDAMATLLAALARRPTRMGLLDLRENTQRLVPALQAAAPPNAARVEVSLDEELEQDRIEQGLCSLDTWNRLTPPIDFPAGALDAARMHEAVQALDGALAAADVAPDA